jgi:hypothetical protein
VQKCINQLFHWENNIATRQFLLQVKPPLFGKNHTKLFSNAQILNVNKIEEAPV